jgi:hypothetical protein
LQELRSQSFDFGAGRLAHGIASQPLPASLLEFFRPAIVARVQILVDAFPAAKLGYAVSPRNTAITIRTFFSAEYCRRMARRIFRTVFSASSDAAPLRSHRPFHRGTMGSLSPFLNRAFLPYRRQGRDRPILPKFSGPFDDTPEI